jgi:hypothetical protein
MRLSDIMGKLGKGLPLTPVELAFLKQQTDLQQGTSAVTSGWITGGNGARISRLRAGRASFDVFPGNPVYRAFGSGDTPIAPDGDGTDINWATADWSSSYDDVIPIVTFSTTKIYCTPQVPTIILMSGTFRLLYTTGAISWAYINLSVCLKSDNSVVSGAGATLARCDDGSEKVIVMPFTRGFYWANPQTTYLKMTVYSDIKAGIDITEVNVLFTRLK